ncbi:MAG: hypothetical protein CMJ94_01630 [Planctomycetes bacterium]|nr:hypothetical protein [Planctomycetota bacterium]
MARLSLPSSLALAAVAFLPACSSWFVSEDVASLSSTRRFVLDYQVVIPPEVNDQLGPVRIWVPVPVSDGVQTIDVLEAPEGVRWSGPDIHGNRFASLVWMGGERELVWSYRVERRQDGGDSAGAERDLGEREAFLHYLDPDVMVPSRGPAVELAFELAEQVERADFPGALFRSIVDQMEYTTEGDVGYGSSDFAAVESVGDAADYAAYFIGGMRYQQYAARFQVGFLLPIERGWGQLSDPHAWAHWYRPDYGWQAVDPGAADLDPDRGAAYYFGTLGSNRVSLSCGRDLVLDPPQQGAPLNFFVAAYGEQDGREVRLETQASYYDL